MNDRTGQLSISFLFLTISIVFVVCLLISNIIAGKLIEVYHTILPAAVILFPITYILGDILTEVYGFEYTRRIIWMGFIANLLMAFIFIITIILPYPAFWDGQESYRHVLGLTPRIIFASIVAYLVGEFANSIVMSKMKVFTQGKWLWARTIGSTIVGEGLDTFVFISITFYGSIEISLIISMILAQYLVKVVYEVVLTPVTYIIINWVKRKEGIDIYDYNVSYNLLFQEQEN